jgi:hypothetical protein
MQEQSTRKEHYAAETGIEAISSSRWEALRFNPTPESPPTTTPLQNARKCFPSFHKRNLNMEIVSIRC